MPSITFEADNGRPVNPYMQLAAVQPPGTTNIFGTSVCVEGRGIVEHLDQERVPVRLLVEHVPQEELDLLLRQGRLWPATQTGTGKSD